MKIILNNGAELFPIVVMGGKQTVQGEVRDVLSFVFSADAGMDALDAAFTAEACESIITIGDDDEENIHKAYTVRAGMKKETLEVIPATDDSPNETVDRITVSMGQRTYQEGQIADMEAALAALAGKEV